MEFVPVAAMAILTLKLVDFLRYARAADLNGVLTQLCAWVGGVVVVLLVAQTDWARGIQIGDKSLHSLSFWSLIFVGLTTGSGASVIKDVGVKALDNSNSAAIPTLAPPSRRATTDSPREVG